MNYLRSSRIYFEDGIRNGYLVFEDQKIVGFLGKEAKVDVFEDYGDERIIPGTFDTHDHGTYGYGDSELAKTNDDALIQDDIRHYLHGYDPACTAIRNTAVSSG